MGWVFLAIGLVFILEGLVVALAPSRIEDLLRLIAQLPIDQRRLVGLIAITVGVFLVSLVRITGL